MPEHKYHFLSVRIAKQNEDGTFADAGPLIQSSKFSFPTSEEPIVFIVKESLPSVTWTFKAMTNRQMRWLELVFSRVIWRRK